MRSESLVSRAHRSTTLLFLFALSLTMACAVAKAQSGSAAALPPPLPPMKQTIYAPIAGIGEFSQWTLEVVNRSNLPIPSLITVFSASGEPLASTTILLGSEESQRIDLKSLIPDNQRRATLGGISLEFTGGAMAVAGQITLSNYHGFGNIDSTLVPDMMFMSNSADAVWWAPEEARSFLILGNSSGEPIRVEVAYSSGHHRTVDIPPRGTAIEHVPHDEGEGRNSAENIQSVHVTGTGMAGTLRVTGYVVSPQVGFLDTIRAYDPALSTESAIYANGLHFSDSSRRLMVKNLQVGPIIVSGTIYPLRSEGTRKLVSLPQKFLEANQSVEMELPENEDPEALDGAALKLESSGPKGSLVATYNSFDHNSQITRSVPFKDLGDTSTVTGGYPWRLDGNYQSTVYITNVGTKTASYGGFIRPAGSGRYVMDTRYLEPGETAVMDIGKIRDEQIPDRDGLKLPKNAQFGEIQWYPFFPNGPSHLIGRTEVINRRAHLDSSFSCGSCPCSPNATNAYTNPGSVGVSVGGKASVYAMLAWSDPCNLNYYADSAFKPSSWLTAPGYVNLTTGTSPSTLTGLSPGSQSFYAPYYSDIYIYNPYAYPICAYEETLELDATGYASVGAPHHLTVVNDVGGYPKACPATGIYVRQMLMQVVDANGSTQTGNPTIAETYAPAQPVNSCGNGSPNAGGCAATGPTSCGPCAAGQFLDTLAVSRNFCNSGIAQGSGCGFSQTSTWSTCGSLGIKALWVSPRTTKSNGVTVDRKSTSWRSGTVCNNTGCH